MFTLSRDRIGSHDQYDDIPRTLTFEQLAEVDPAKAYAVMVDFADSPDAASLLVDLISARHLRDPKVRAAYLIERAVKFVDAMEKFVALSSEAEDERAIAAWDKENGAEWWDGLG